MNKPLTAKTIENLKPQADRYERRDGTRNLYIVVYPHTGKKQFICRYRFGGKKKKTTFRDVTLEGARKLAGDWMYKVAQGIDPAVEKRKEANAAADTLETICQEYLRLGCKNLRTAGQRKDVLERLVYPALGACQIETITRSQISRLMDKIEIDNGERTADLMRAYLNAAFEWHAARSDTFSNPIVKRMRRYKPADHARDRVLTDDELRAIWKATEGGDPASAIVRFLLLTGARRSEAAGLRWDEIAGDVWTLPADAGPDRNKTKKELKRPLSKAALAIVEAQPRMKDGPLVFSYGRHMPSFSLLKQKIDEASGATGWRLHDLRRTARTLLSGCPGISADLAELTIGHTKKGVRATYDRHDYLGEMRAAFEALAARIEIITNPPKGNVRQFRR